MALFPVLVTCLPEADLKLITSPDELQQCYNPFHPQHACAILRHTRQLSLSALQQSGTAGFMSAAKDQEPVVQSDLTEHLAPWIPSYDDWARLLEVLAGQLEPVMLLVRLRPRSDLAAEQQRLEAMLQQCELINTGADDQLVGMRKTAMVLEELTLGRLESLQHPCFDLAALLVSGQPLPTSLAAVFGNAVSGIRQQHDELAWLQGGHQVLELADQPFMQPDFFPEQQPFSLVEAACAFRLPSPPHREIPGLAVQRFRANLAMLPPELDESPASIRLSLNEFQGMSQPVHIDPNDRMRHTYVMGQTGTGKSSLLEYMIVQDIHAGRGVAVIDPHGDMIDNVMKSIPRERAEDVILFDLLDRERPVAFNLLQWSDIAERDLIIDELYRTLDHIYDMKLTGGPIFEMHFRNMLKLLMGDERREDFTPTLLEFIRCYTDTSFRHWLKGRMSDQQVLDFIQEAEQVSGEIRLNNVAPYITSKFGRFVNDTTLKNIVGQEVSSFDVDEIMNRGKIFLIKLGKGRFGSQISALLANMLVARFKYCAMKRGELPMDERRDFYLYVDEAHNLPHDNVSELLSEARKYRLGLILATQYCSQLGKVHGSQDDLLAAIFGNVGSIITFRTGSQDAELLAKGFTPHFSPLDIMSLPNFHGYARMNLGGQSMAPFSFRTELHTMPENNKLAQLILNLSRLKYGYDKSVVEYEIDLRAKCWKNEQDKPTSSTNAVPFVNLLLLDLPRTEFELSCRTERILVEQLEIHTVRALLAQTRRHLFKKLGRKGFTELEQEMERFGLLIAEEGSFEPETIPETIDDCVVAPEDNQ